MANEAGINILVSLKDQFTKGFKAIGGDIDKIADKMKSTGSSMTAFLSVPIVGAGLAAVKAASDIETLQTSFVSLTGGAEQAALMMKNLNDFTAKTPFQLEEVASSAKQLIASGVGIEDVNNKLQFLGDIAATSGSNINDIASIFAKVNAKGKVELDALNSLAERGIPIFTALSEATGLPAEKLGGGAVSVEQFNAVLKSFSEEGGLASGAMERLSETAAGKFSTAMDNLKLAGASLAASLLPVINQLLDGVTALAAWFANLSPAVQKTVLVIAALAAAIGPLVYAAGVLITSIQAVGAALLFLSANPIILIIAGIAALIAAIYLIIQNWEEVKNKTIEIWDYISLYLSGLWTTLTLTIATALRTISNFIKNIFEGIKITFVEIWENIKGVFVAAWTSLKNLVHEGLLGISNLVNSSTDTLKNAFGNMWQGISGVIASALDGIKQMVFGVINWIIDKINAVIEKINGATSSAAEFFGGTGESVKINTIPKLAKGGIVTGPTIAQIGEAGPEAVIPLSGSNRPNLGGHTIIIKNNTLLDERAGERIGDMIMRELSLNSQFG